VAAAVPPKLAQYKQEAVASIDGMYGLAQQMVDSVFSFGEIGFQEHETQRYLTAILEREGFTVQRGVAGIPTAWTARFGSGKPVIALGSDVDGIPQASQKPGVAYRDPIIDGAPGHGEGHNSGVPLNIVAAIAVKRIMQRDKLPGTIVLWPGVAEELLATKAYYVRGDSSRTSTSSSTTTSAPTFRPDGETAPGTGSSRSSTHSRANPPTAPMLHGAGAARWMQWS
jgi:aminobenzoyl-glutamate utilization protein B